jgi:hypothetical protein
VGRDVLLEIWRFGIREGHLGIALAFETGGSFSFFVLVLAITLINDTKKLLYVKNCCFVSLVTANSEHNAGFPKSRNLQLHSLTTLLPKERVVA